MSTKSSLVAQLLSGPLRLTRFNSTDDRSIKFQFSSEIQKSVSERTEF